MSGASPACRDGGVALLERAVAYTLGSLWLVTPGTLARPTPCQGWDVRALLAHLADSLAALTEAVTGRVEVPLPAGPGATGEDRGAPAAVRGNPVAVARAAAGRLVGAWAGTSGRPAIHVAGGVLTPGVVAGAGAIEVAVHGWDIAVACRVRRPLPPPLAEELLELAPLLVAEVDRPVRFAAPVRVPPLASPNDRLVAYLGRRPHTIG